MIEIICDNCGKKCEKPSKEINRQRKNGKVRFFCSLSCSSTTLKTTTSEIERKCLWCQKIFLSTTHKKSKVCCSKKCASKYAQSRVDSEIHKKSVQRMKHYPMEKEFVCVVCGNKFFRKVNNGVVIRKTCSKKCYSILDSKWTRENPNCGGKLGYRRFKYRGFTMDSRWEVDLAKWMDEKYILWERNRKYMFLWVDENGNDRKYFPDFYLPSLNVYLDPKNNFYLQRDLPKLKYVIQKYGITLLYGNLDIIQKQLETI